MYPDRIAELPRDFIWKEIRPLKARFAMPDTWFSKEENLPGTYGIFLTRERIGGQPLRIVGSQGTMITSTPDGYFKTGLSVNVMVDIDTRIGMKPSQMARALLESQKQMKPAGPTYSRREGAFRILRRLFTTDEMTVQGTQMEPTHHYYETTGNDRTGTLYIISFETPSRLWTVDEETAKVMVEQRQLDEEI